MREADRSCPFRAGSKTVSVGLGQVSAQQSMRGWRRENAVTRLLKVR